MNDLNKTFVILDNVRSAFNVGAIFRTADAAKVSEILLVGITPTPPLEKLKKTSIGAIDYVKWKHFEKVEEAINYVMEQDTQIKIFSVEQKENSKIYYLEDMTINSIAFIFGHEIMGVSPKAIEMSDGVLELPMRGFKNSLNVATSVGILVYERARQIETNGLRGELKDAK